MAKMLNQTGLPEETLPFVVKLQENEAELEQLLALRALCYGHHIPYLAESCRTPQECDFYDSTLNIIAVDKQNGNLLGAIRTEIAFECEISIQADLEIPKTYRESTLATATKFCIKPSAHMKLVRLALFKSFYMSLVMNQVKHLIIIARKELEVFYQKNLCNCDLYQDNPYRIIQSVGGIQHRIYGMSVDALYDRWVTTPHPNIHFLTHIRHPDIALEKKHRSYETPYA